MPARKKSARKAATKKASPRKKVAAKRATGRKAASPAAGATPPSAIGAMNHHIDYTTHDLEGVKRFYTSLLGFSQYDQDQNFNYLWIQTGHSSSMGFMPPMPEMGEPSPAREPTLYFIVKDVDGAYAKLSSKGVMFEGPPADMPWGHRVVRTTDPEGRSVMLATPKNK